MQKTRCGIVSTSANISESPYVSDIKKLDKEITDNVDYIVNLPLKTEASKPSQIIKIGAGGEVTIIRK